MPGRRTSHPESVGPGQQALHDGPEKSRERAASNSDLWPCSIAALLALVGLADAIYLTIEHLTGQSVRCTITSGCDEVLSSPYASIRGIPLAAFGALAYFTAFSLALLIAFGYERLKTPLRLLVALMFLMALWLLYVQAFVLHAFCQYCLLSAVVTISLSATVAFAWRSDKR
ncbi:MAG TPA: vitamin K epoxide reductase family protein [Pyrinomonadaceae bacterium]|jgi:uncharacterized membrane protein|nr:vitamin K epoxide reductase family protein [Pyrinomonadaceae bacterium]